MVSCIILCIRLVFHELSMYIMYIKICKFVYSTVFITRLWWFVTNRIVSSRRKYYAWLYTVSGQVVTILFRWNPLIKK
jgi:hypothetical protein